MLNVELLLPFNSIGVRIFSGSNDPNELVDARSGSVLLRLDARPNSCR